ncbi:hypothetical protein HDU97_008695 [Phlyctochytrium planicorne]|nr:hypothetical protein HDU97_008695 [Phlyctochytrium planicorne]
MVLGKGKGKVIEAPSGVTIEDIVDSDDDQKMDDGDDFDVDNMDFDLPPELVGSSGHQPLLMTKAEAARALAKSSSSSSPSTSAPIPSGQPKHINQLDPNIREAMKKWTVVYPVYMDSSRSSRQGRMIAASAAVKDPSIVYLGECCKVLGLNTVVERNKRHPKDPLCFGRVRVQIKELTGQPIRAEIPNKKALILKLVSLYPEVKEAMIKADPRVESAAAALRSEMAKVVEETYKEATKEIKAKESGGQKGNKKGKKKK